MLTSIKIVSAGTQRSISFPLHTETRMEVLPIVTGFIELNLTEEDMQYFSVTLERIN
jgi:hypothetical protein